MTRPTERFSDRVTDYVRARPGYPASIPALLAERCGLTPDWQVTDVGSGPGNLARLFLDNGNQVTGVEPNREMRLAGERMLAGYPRFTSVAGRAEATGLPSRSCDLVSAGQAFHWFDPGPARAEFARISRRPGWVVLVWNDRAERASATMCGYEELLRRYGTDYRQAHHRRIGATEIAAFYAPRTFERIELNHSQTLDRDGLRARMLSSSYTPSEGTPQRAELVAAVDRLFDHHERQGRVDLIYRTRVYLGRSD
ncbi:MAG TPA: class I SAM-dependent methyltransferase [Candidatus Polarisedimenticolaceae bacterium]|nr:class I SAM-dependent methyltransferase [Candidatus Polarisedimenticolaceae bacterium]